MLVFLSEVPVLHRQGVAWVPRCHHVTHSHLRPIVFWLRASSKLLQERGAEFYSHLWIHQKGCCLQSEALLPQGREAVLTVHWALPLLQKVNCGLSFPLSYVCAVLDVESDLNCRWAILLYESVGSLWGLLWLKLRAFQFKIYAGYQQSFAETLILWYAQGFIQEGKFCQVPLMSGQDYIACKMGFVVPFVCVHLCHNNYIRFWKRVCHWFDNAVQQAEATWKICYILTGAS